MLGTAFPGSERTFSSAETAQELAAGVTQWQTQSADLRCLSPNRYKRVKVGWRSPGLFPIDWQLRDADELISGQAQDMALQEL